MTIDAADQFRSWMEAVSSRRPDDILGAATSLVTSPRCFRGRGASPLAAARGGQCSHALGPGAPPSPRPAGTRSEKRQGGRRANRFGQAGTETPEPEGARTRLLLPAEK
ncbi:unnamed protein product, partial [Prorocentrum cordatum]